MRKYEIAVLSKGAYARTVRIYAPKKADRAVIMHDGQNAFTDSEATYGKSWRAIDVLKSIGAKNIAIIGIDSVMTRFDDYIPFQTDIDDYGMEKCGGKTDMYVDYIDGTVLPYLDKRFGFKAYGMLGSSAGALATLYYAARKNTKFKAYGMFSAPLFVSNTAFDKFFEHASFDADAIYRVYSGGSEKTVDTENAALMPDLFVSDAFKLTAALRKSGVKNLITKIDQSGIHDETCWRESEKEFFEVFSSLQI